MASHAITFLDISMYTLMGIAIRCKEKDRRESLSGSLLSPSVCSFYEVL
jgi:hypothetical protein